MWLLMYILAASAFTYPIRYVMHGASLKLFIPYFAIGAALVYVGHNLM